MGDLLPLFRLVRARLAPDGLFLSSVELSLSEAGSAPDWALGRLGRYGHSAGYVEAAARAAGLQTLFMRPETIRLEGCAEVRGLFVGCRRIQS